MTARQRRLHVALIAVMVVAVAAAKLTTGTPSSGQPRTDQPSALPSFDFSYDPIPRIAIAYDVGGRGIAGFNHLAWEGATRAADEFDGEVVEVSGGPDDTDADREKRLEQLAVASYYPIFTIGPSYARAVATVAPRHRGSWFVLIDDDTVDAPNVIGIQFNEGQGSFLVGAAAALTSRTGTVGFIGTVRTTALDKLEAGFTAGARAADPDVEVQVAYLARPAGDAGDGNPAAARKTALGMFDQGADVIFGASGDSSSGVIQAAHDRGLWAIGVDSDQYLLADPSVRGAILTSMLKRADVVTDTITMEVAQSVPKDGNNVFGLDRDGVGFATSGGFVDPIKAQLDAFAAQLAQGRIRVPTKP